MLEDVSQMLNNVTRKGGKWLSARVPEECIAIARELGDGNKSIGVRKALVEAAMKRGLRGLWNDVEQACNNVKQEEGKLLLGARVTQAEIEAVKRIGGGNTTNGVRIAIEEAAVRRGIIQNSTREELQKFQALGYGGAEVLEAVERTPLPIWLIAERTGLAEDKVTGCIEVLVARGLIAEVEKGYAPTEEGWYMLAILDAVGRDLRDLRKGEGLKGVTFQHAELVKRLAGKRADIKALADKLARSADLTKRNAEDLMKIVS